MKRKLFSFLKKHLLLTGLLSIVTLAISFVVGIYFISFLLGPPSLMNKQNTVLYSHDQEVISEENNAENLEQVSLDHISPKLIDATLAVEDRHFYQHHGFDFRRIFGAIVSNIKSFSLKEGASTITQQLARNLYLSFEKTWIRKAKEAIYTIRLEMYYSKDEILAAYLNSIHYGHGAYGIEAASNHFYGKSADELDWAEAAMLAGIPKGPTYYSPFNDPERAKKRQVHILSLLRNTGHITEETYEVAVNEKLNYVKADKPENDTTGPHFRDMALQEAAKALGLDVESVRSGSFQIYTTLDTDLQKKLEDKIEDTITDKSEIEVGAIALNPNDGGIQALIGGRDYEASAFNRAYTAKRMPGSTFKPFLYYAALNNGYTPSTKLISKPTEFTLDSGDVYQPGNFNGYYADGPITLAQALALSDNIFAVKTNMFLGNDTLVDTAKDFGITSKLPDVPSLALGTAAVSVKEMVTGYGMLANGGQEIKAHTVNKITDPHGKVIFERDGTDGEQKLDPQNAFILTQLMTGMFDSELDGYMAVTGSTIADKLTRTYAGKSGTTNADSWMIGYSPTLVTGIWTGYDDNRPMEIADEVTYAKDIWASFMETAHEDVPEKKFSPPANVIGIPIDPETGERATPYCSSSRVMYFEKGTEPQTHCTTHLPDGEGQDNKEKEERGMMERLFDLFR